MGLVAWTIFIEEWVTEEIEFKPNNASTSILEKLALPPEFTVFVKDLSSPFIVNQSVICKSHSELFTIDQTSN